MKTLKIDEKWSVEYDETQNDRPVNLLRYGEPAGVVRDWSNPQTPMFYALLVCGGRDYADRTKVFRTLDLLKKAWGMDREPDQRLIVIQGGARGADLLAKEWAKARGVPCLEVKADWDKHGKQAGILRNIEMMDKYQPGLVVAFPGGTGTKHMIGYARKKGAHVWEVK